jgi:hypothetical protein
MLLQHVCCTGCCVVVLCAALALFNTISHPFHVFPKAIQLWASSKVAMDRITSFLLEKVTFLPHVMVQSSTLCGHVRCMLHAFLWVHVTEISDLMLAVHTLA